MEPTLLDLLSLPEPRDLVVFERPPLVFSICQVRFTRILGIADSKFVAPFQQAIQDCYPVAKPGEELTVAVQTGAGGATIQQEQRSNRWEFTDREDNWKVVLGEEFLAIETRAYDSFSDFLGRLRQAVSALAEHVHPPIVTRIGLRYINEIRLTDQDPREAVNPQLLGPISVPELAGGVEQSIQQLALRYTGNYGVNVIHGLVPRGSMVGPRPGEQPAAGPFYLIDLDAFRTFPLPGGLTTDADEICGQVEGFNRALYRFFRWAVTDQYTSGMGVRRYATGFDNPRSAD